METKMTKENQIDEIGTKKMRTDWKDPDIVARFLKVMSVPRRRIDIVNEMKIEYPQFKDGQLELMFRRLTPIIGSLKTEQGLYHVKDLDTAIELYKLHVREKLSDKEVIKAAEKAVEETSSEELKEFVDSTKRGAKSGYRKETWRNIMIIIDIIVKEGGLIRIDDLISRYKKQTKQVSFNLARLDQYSSIMEELGIPFDYSHQKRIGLTVPNCKLVIADKYNKASGWQGTAEDLTKVKKIDSLSKALNILTPEERKATVIQIAKIMYFSKSVTGVKFSDIPVYYEKMFLKKISLEVVMGAASELRQKLDEGSFKFYTGSAKVLNWEAVLRMYDPEQLFIKLVIKEPTGKIDMIHDFGSNSNVNKVDDCIWEVAAVNDEKLTRLLMKIIMLGGRILSPSRIEDRVKEIIEDRINGTEIMIS